MGKQRNLYIDILKGMLIILVVMGHVVQYIFYPHSDGAYRENGLWTVIYMFHMPLFIAISGYFTYFSLQKHDLRTYLVQRAKSLLLPLVVWSLLAALLVWFLAADRPGFLTNILFKVKDYYWFIWAIIIFSALLGVMHRLRIDNLPVLMVCSLSILLPISFYPLSIIKDMLPFFVAGYLFAKTARKEIFSIVGRRAIVPLLVLSVGYYIILSGQIADSALLSVKPVLLVIRFTSKIVLSLTFMVLIYHLYTFIKGKKAALLLVNIGSQTLGIYLIQGLIFGVVDECFVFAPPKYFYFTVFIFTFVIILASWGLLRLISKNRIANIFLLGKYTE